jgi:hypothetical protein
MPREILFEKRSIDLKRWCVYNRIIIRVKDLISDEEKYIALSRDKYREIRYQSINGSIFAGTVSDDPRFHEDFCYYNNFRSHPSRVDKIREEYPEYFV